MRYRETLPESLLSYEKEVLELSERIQFLCHDLYSIVKFFENKAEDSSQIVQKAAYIRDLLINRFGMEFASAGSLNRDEGQYKVYTAGKGNRNIKEYEIRESLFFKEPKIKIVSNIPISQGVSGVET